MKIKEPDYQYCPFCKKDLEIKIQENKERKWCPDCNWIYYPRVASSVLALIVKKDKVLMVKRARKPYKNTWMFPAGFIDFAEHPEEALAREVKEETGLDIKKTKLLKIYQCKDDPRAMGHIVFCYQVDVKDGRLSTDEDENSDICWFDIDNLPNIGWEVHNQVIRDFL